MSNSKHTMTHVRDRLGEALDGLLDKKKPMDIERAKAVADVAQVIINSAKVEVDHMRVTGGKGSGFIPEANMGTPALPNGTHSPQPGVLVHRMDDRK